MRRIIHPPLRCSLAGIYRQPLVSRRQVPLHPELQTAPAPSPTPQSGSQEGGTAYPEPSSLTGTGAATTDPLPPRRDALPGSASRRGARPALGAAALPISNCKLIKSSSRGAEAAWESCPRRSAEEAAGAAAAWKLKREEGKNTLRPRQRPTGQENNPVTHPSGVKGEGSGAEPGAGGTHKAREGPGRAARGQGFGKTKGKTTPGRFRGSARPRFLLREGRDEKHPAAGRAQAHAALSLPCPCPVPALSGCATCIWQSFDFPPITIPKPSHRCDAHYSSSELINYRVIGISY